jgi:heme-degrading monooxygenase HmoA
VVTEVADISVTPGQESDFEAAYRRGRVHLLASPGCRSVTMTRSIESPSRFVLMVEWERLEDHTVTFREGDGFAQWRAEVGPFFASPPSVEHVEAVPESS